MQVGDDSGFSTFNGQVLNKFNQQADWGVGDNDRRHRIALSAVYELPIHPKGKVAKAVLGGWQLSGAAYYQSGTPHRIGASGSPLASGNRANWNRDVPLNVDWSNAFDGYKAEKDGSGNIYFPAPLPGEATPFDVFNIAAFSSPGRWVLGNSPHRINGLRNRWDKEENVALAKRFSIGRTRTELRLEFFNVLNRRGTCGVETNVNNRDRFGLSNGYRIRNAAGQVIGVHIDQCQGTRPRSGQVFLKIGF
jgi:hypothetical protein